MPIPKPGFEVKRETPLQLANAMAKAGTDGGKRMAWALKKALLMGMIQRSGYALGQTVVYMLLTALVITATLYQYLNAYRVVPPFTFVLILVWAISCYAFKEASVDCVVIFANHLVSFSSCRPAVKLGIVYQLVLLLQASTR